MKGVPELQARAGIGMATGALEAPAAVNAINWRLCSSSRKPEQVLHLVDSTQKIDIPYPKALGLGEGPGRGFGIQKPLAGGGFCILNVAPGGGI